MKEVESGRINEATMNAVLEHCRIIVIYDDVGQDKNARKKDGVLQKLASMGRHFAMTVICCVQYLCQVTPEFRKQSNVIIATTVEAEKDFKAMYSDFWMNSDGDINVMKNVIQVATIGKEKYGKCFYYRRVKEGSLLNKAFILRPKLIPRNEIKDFELYSQETVRQIKYYFDENWRDKIGKEKEVPKTKGKKGDKSSQHEIFETDSDDGKK